MWYLTGWTFPWVYLIPQGDMKWSEVTLLFLIVIPSVLGLDGEVRRKKDHKSWRREPIGFSWDLCFMGTLDGYSLVERACSLQLLVRSSRGLLLTLMGPLPILF